MASSSVCWGIEIGANAVKAVKLEVEGGGVRLADMAIVPHAKVLSTPELDKDEALRLSLASLVASRDLSGATIAVSVAGHQSFARFAKLPPVEPKKVPDIVKFEAVQQIPFPLEDVEWDYQTFTSPDSPEVEVGIFAITRPRIMELLNLLSEVGITPDLATIGPVAAYNALAYDLSFTEQSPGTIILDIGTTATDLIVADAGRVWVRTFSIGGHQFTEALSESFNQLSYTKAERLKREAQQSKHARHIFQAMRPVFTDLVQEIQRSIGYYGSIHPGAELKRLIGLGSTFNLPGLRRYLKQQLQMDVYRIEQFKRLTVDPAREPEVVAAASNLVTAYGLALQGLGNGTLQANLMPTKVVREAMWKAKRGWFAAAAGLAAATAAAAFLRPLLDNTAFSSLQRPQVIQTAANEARLAAGNAEAEGVTGATEGDDTAAQIASLTDGRGLYAMLLRDVRELLAAGASAAEDLGGVPEGAEAPLRLASLTTAFASKAGDAAGAGFGSGSWQDPSAAAAGGSSSDALDATQYDRVVVTARFTTPLPNARDMLRDAIEPWFARSTRREGVPYVVQIDGDPTRTLAPAAGAAGPGAGVPGYPPGGPGLTRPGLNRPGPARPGQSPGRGPGFSAGPGFSPGGTGFVPGAPGVGSDPQAPSDDELIRRMQAAAPIGPEAVRSGPADAFSFEVQWVMLLNVPEASAEPGGDS